MTATEAARQLGISKGTLYRWLRKGKNTNRVTGVKQGRRWEVTLVESQPATPKEGDNLAPTPSLTPPPPPRPSEPKVAPATPPTPVSQPTPAPAEPKKPWPWYVHESARQDGRSPEDFQFDQWGLSNVEIAGVLPATSYLAESYDYVASIPADTPQANQYDEQNQPLPDPTGLALSRVKFQLREVGTSELLDESNTGHINGEARTHSGSGSDTKLWERLLPNGPEVQVELVARPLFYFLDTDGGMRGDYANMGLRGYFGGEEVTSRIYTLRMDQTGALFLDGLGAPEPAAPAAPIPSDYQEGETLGGYIRRKREAVGKSRADVGSTTSTPWLLPSGDTTYDVDAWMGHVEADEVVPNDNQLAGIAIECGIEEGNDGLALFNLAVMLNGAR